MACRYREIPEESTCILLESRSKQQCLHIEMNNLKLSRAECAYNTQEAETGESLEPRNSRSTPFQQTTPPKPMQTSKKELMEFVSTNNE